MLEQALDANDPIIREIHFTEGDIVKSQLFDDLDAFDTWIRSSEDYPWESDRSAGVWPTQWLELKEHRWKFQRQWDTYQGELSPLSFYVAAQRTRVGNNLLVLLRVGREGDRRRTSEESSFLWTFTTPD
jgi:hypothetical protein